MTHQKKIIGVTDHPKSLNPGKFIMAICPIVVHFTVTVEVLSNYLKNDMTLLSSVILERPGEDKKSRFRFR